MQCWGLSDRLRGAIHMTSNLSIEHKYYIMYYETDRYIRGGRESKSCRDNDETKQIPSMKR